MKRFLSFLCILILLLTAGCGDNKQSGSKAMQPLVFGIMPDVDSVPLVIAQEKGFFKEAGVNVTLKSFKSAMDRDASLQSGNLDGTISDILAAAFAKTGGFDVKVTSMSDGCYKLITSDENIKGIKDLVGKDTAVSRNTIIEYVTDRMLEQEKLAADSIDKVVVPQIPVRLEMLQNKKLTAATLPEPMASVALANGSRLIASSDELKINPGIMLFTGKACKEKKEEIKAFYRAYNKAVQYLRQTKREDYIGLVTEKSGFPAAAAKALVLPKYHDAVLPSEADFTACMKWLEQKKLLKGKTCTYGDLVSKELLP